MIKSASIFIKDNDMVNVPRYKLQKIVGALIDLTKHNGVTIYNNGENLIAEYSHNGLYQETVEAVWEPIGEYQLQGQFL